jgi:hypothetical protein
MKTQQHWSRPAGFLIVIGLVAFGFVLFQLIVSIFAVQYPGVPAADIGSLSATAGLAIAASAIGVSTLQLFMMWLQISQADDVASEIQTSAEILKVIQELTSELRQRPPIVHNHYQTSLFSFPDGRTDPMNRTAPFVARVPERSAGPPAGAE